MTNRGYRPPTRSGARIMPTYEELASCFSGPELALIEDSAWVDEFGNRHDGLVSTIGWVSHVEKLDKDRALPMTDRTIWTEHDLAAALFIRDFLARALDKLPSAIAQRLSPFAEEADARFQSFTIQDSGARMATVAGVDLSGRGWWWYRVPADGPVAVFLSRYKSPSESQQRSEEHGS